MSFMFIEPAPDIVLRVEVEAVRAWGRKSQSNGLQSNGLHMTPRHRFFSYGFSQRPLNNPLTAHKPLAPGTRPATSGGRRPRLRGASRHPCCRTSFRSSWTTPQVMPPEIRGQQVQGTLKSKADKPEADKTEDGMGPAATSLSHIIRWSWTTPQADCFRSLEPFSWPATSVPFGLSALIRRSQASRRSS